MQHFKPKQLTFQQEHNIALTKQTYNKDPLDLDYNNWVYLFDSMKTRGLNEKQIRKNVNKYQQNIINIIQNSHNTIFDKSKTTMKQKIIDLNHQLRIRLGEIFQFISMLHMQQLQQVVQFVYGGFMTTIQKMGEVFEEMREGYVKMQRDLQDWKLRKKNVLCYSCNKNVQESKLRNITTEIGSTISSETPVQITDNQHKVEKLSSQCKTLEMQLQSMSKQHFFTFESDNLIQKINDVLKTRIITAQKHDRKENTTQMLANCLHQLNEVIKPLEIDYNQETSKDMRKLKKLTTIIGANSLSINDLNNTQQFTNKLMTIFSEPIHRFIVKYQEILQNKTKKEQEQKQMKEKQQEKQLKNQQTQTSLIKQPQAIKNLQKQVMSLTRQLNLLKASKQKVDKQLYSMYDLVKEKQTKVIEAIAQSKLYQQINKEQENELRQLKRTVKGSEQVFTQQKQSIIKSFTQEKSQLTKHISHLESQVQILKYQNTFKSLKFKCENKQTQTYRMSLYVGTFQEALPLQKSTQTQTHYDAQTYHHPHHQNKNHNTFRSIKPKNHNKTNPPQQQVITTNSPSNIFQIKKKHFKAKSQTPSDAQPHQFSQTARNFIRQKQFNTLPSSPTSNKLNKTVQFHQITQKQTHTPSIFQTINMNITDQSLSTKKSFIPKQERRPSINSMIPQTQQISKSCIPSQKINLKKQTQSQLEQSQSSSASNIFNSGHKLVSTNKNFQVNQQNQQNLQIPSKQKRAFLSTTFQNCHPSKQEQNDTKLNETQPLVIHNFNEISSIFAQRKDIDQFLVSKLKKVSKQQLKKQTSNLLGNKSNKKVVIKSCLQTPINQGVQESLRISKIGNQIESKSRQMIQKIKEKNHKVMISPTNQILSSQKQKIFQILYENYQYFDKIGLINMIEDCQQKSTESASNNSRKSLTSLNKLKQVLIKNEIKKKVQHIQKKDIQLFFSLQQAIKYEHRAGLWNEIDSCIMVDNNFSKITDQVQKYFEHLKTNKKGTYNQYFIFLKNPSKFMKQILDQKNCDLQKQKVLKETIKLQKSSTSIHKKTFIKDTFKKLIKLHKIMHKNGCDHVEKFLQKIGFYNYQTGQNHSNQRSLQKSRIEDRPVTKNQMSLPKSFKI